MQSTTIINFPHEPLHSFWHESINHNFECNIYCVWLSIRYLCSFENETHIILKNIFIVSIHSTFSKPYDNMCRLQIATTFTLLVGVALGVAKYEADQPKTELEGNQDWHLENCDGAILSTRMACPPGENCNNCWCTTKEGKTLDWKCEWFNSKNKRLFKENCHISNENITNPPHHKSLIIE